MLKANLTFWVIEDRNLDGKTFSSSWNPILNEGRILVGTKSKRKHLLRTSEIFKNIIKLLNILNILNFCNI